MSGALCLIVKGVRWDAGRFVCGVGRPFVCFVRVVYPEIPVCMSLYGNSKLGRLYMSVMKTIIFLKWSHVMIVELLDILSIGCGDIS